MCMTTSRWFWRSLIRDAMISFNVCKKCPHGTFGSPREDEDGNIVVMPSIECGMIDSMLLMNSDVPDGCPFVLEHSLITQSVPTDFADKMSGGKKGG